MNELFDKLYVARTNSQVSPLVLFNGTPEEFAKLKEALKKVYASYASNQRLRRKEKHVTGYE